MTTILIVEDNKPLNQLYAEVMRMAGYEIHQAASCQEAKDCLERVVPDIVVLDMLLPDGNGQSILTFIRETLILHKIHVIAVSGFQGEMSEADSLSIDDFLVKPVAIPALIESVERLSKH